ncbi:DHH family phosphoesterase [Haloarchaeobius sp. DFWS5]|uniref:DHH family phosphoesterase n=1 Tax=Haloarchaeobius sp. DFWS5 TaxID=3446114 RepID=UPI003EC07345
MSDATAEISDVLALLDGPGSVLVVCHRHADLDALGSARALATLLDDVTVCTPGGVGQSAHPLAGPAVERADPANFDLTVVVDSAAASRVGPIDLDRAGRLVVVDHHPPDDLARRADAAFVDPEAGATAELVYQLARAAGWDLSSDGAFFLLAGIMSDTQRLALADAETLDAVVALLSIAGERAYDLPALLGPNWREGERLACLRAMQRVELFGADDLVVAVSHVGSFASTAAAALVDGGADLAVVLSERDGTTRVAVRSSGTVHVDVILDPLLAVFEGSGGGHADAGAATVETSREQVRARLDEVLKASLGLEPL